MYNHSPKDYECPICLAISGIENDQTWIKQSDIFYRDDLILGFISSKSIKGNENHPLLVPLKHFENLYDIPVDYAAKIIEISKKVAVALKSVRNCDGVTVVQNNEPAGDQHAFHYHMHLVPRFKNDTFHTEFYDAKKSEQSERINAAKNLRDYLINIK